MCRSMRRKRVTQKCMMEHTIVVCKVLQLHVFHLSSGKACNTCDYWTPHQQHAVS